MHYIKRTSYPRHAYTQNITGQRLMNIV